MGVIYVPVSRTLYFADDSMGAYRVNNVDYQSAGLSIEDFIERAELLPLEQPDTKGYVVVASRSHLSPETESYIQKLESEFGHVNIISCGSSIKICRVAEGAADIYPRFAPTMEWDTAAGHAIARAAGKNVYQRDEKNHLHYNKENLLNPWFIVK
jgi:3'(2'), 5'-bisphosphate nucleotidase